MKIKGSTVFVLLIIVALFIATCCSINNVHRAFDELDKTLDKTFEALDRLEKEVDKTFDELDKTLDKTFEALDRVDEAFDRLDKNLEEGFIGGQKDEYGCLIAAGYTWCESKQKCLRVWEESCNE